MNLIDQQDVNATSYKKAAVIIEEQPNGNN